MMTKKPRSILEYPVVVRKVLEDMVISIPDLGFWIQLPLPPKKINLSSNNHAPQDDLNEEYLLALARGIKSAWIKGHKHILEKKWAPDASTFKQSIQKAERDLTVPQFLKRLKPHLDISENTVRREIKRGAIKCKQTKGGHNRIPLAELEIYLAKVQKFSTESNTI